MENYIVINGKKAELTPEQLKVLGIVTEKKSLFGRIKYDKIYYYIDDEGNVDCDYEGNLHPDDKRFKIGNYCTDEDIMQQRAYHEILNRLLWRYSMEHDGDKIDWNNHNADKYRIRYHHDMKKFVAESNQYIQSFSAVYFHTKEAAKNAIKEIVEPFMEAHPDFTF